MTRQGELERRSQGMEREIAKSQERERASLKECTVMEEKLNQIQEEHQKMSSTLIYTTHENTSLKKMLNTYELELHENTQENTATTTNSSNITNTNMNNNTSMDSMDVEVSMEEENEEQVNGKEGEDGQDDDNDDTSNDDIEKEMGLIMKELKEMITTLFQKKDEDNLQEELTETQQKQLLSELDRVALNMKERLKSINSKRASQLQFKVQAEVNKVQSQVLKVSQQLKELQQKYSKQTHTLSNSKHSLSTAHTHNSSLMARQRVLQDSVDVSQQRIETLRLQNASSPSITTLTSTKSRVTKLELLLKERDEENQSIMKEYNKVCLLNDALTQKVNKGEYNPNNTRVLHLTMNPVKEARSLYKAQIQSVRNHVTQQLSQIHVLFNDYENEAITTTTNGAQDSSKLIHASFIDRQHMDVLSAMQILLQRIPRSINHSQGQRGAGHSGKTDAANATHSNASISSSSENALKVASLEKKLKRYQEVFVKLRQKYKEVVYLLTGWKINMDQVGNVHAESMYSMSEHHRLHFKYDSTTEDMVLVGTPYSDTLSQKGSNSDAMLVLTTTHSFPGFLATLTSELLDQSTLTLG